MIGTERAHFSLTLRMEAQGRQGWNSPSLQNAAELGHPPQQPCRLSSVPRGAPAHRREALLYLTCGRGGPPAGIVSRLACSWAHDAGSGPARYPALCQGGQGGGGEKGTPRPSSTAGRGAVGRDRSTLLRTRRGETAGRGLRGGGVLPVAKARLAGAGERRRGGGPHILSAPTRLGSETERFGQRPETRPGVQARHRA